MLPSLQARLDEIQSRRRRTLAELAAASAEQREFHPRAGAWSQLDVARHLTLVEGKTTRVLAQRRVTGVPRRPVVDAFVRQPLLWLYFGSPWRAKIPAQSVAPDPAMSFEQVTRDWEAAHAMLAQHLDTIGAHDTRTIVYRHPVAGYMDIFDTLRFVAGHHDHHREQLGRIRRAHGFPATPRGAPGTA
jgi:uncharacterized damage-inducible protein DinB